MPPSTQFMRGAKPTPQHILLRAPTHKVVFKSPPQIAYVPKQLDVWGNDTYGDCVSAEEAFNCACYNPEIFIQAQIVIDWARKNGFLNGADLGSVLDAMKSNGFVVGSQQYNVGDKSTVDYSNESILQNAIAQATVKIAIDAGALPSGAGNQMGWYATGGGRHPNTDHCVSLPGYGPAGWLFQQLGVPLPSALQSNQMGYLLYTWKTIGFVDHAWLMGTCTEAWLRTPSTVGVPPLQPPTPPVIDWGDA